jgi:hypothetical protein
MNRPTHIARLAAIVLLSASTALAQPTPPANPSATDAPATQPSAPPAPIPAAAAPTSQPQLELKRRLFPGSTLTLDLPATWTRTYWGQAFTDTTGRCQATLIEVPFPYRGARRGVEPNGPFIQGYTVDRRDNITVQDRDGVIVRGTRTTADGIETRYFICFGTSIRSIYLTFSFPTEQEKTFEPVVARVVSSINWLPDGAPNTAQRFPFDFTAPAGLKQSGVTNNRLIFNESGKRNIDINDAFMFVITTRRDAKGSMDKAEFQTNLENAVGKDKKLTVLEVTKARFGVPGGENARIGDGWDGFGSVPVPQATSPEPGTGTAAPSKLPAKITVYLAQFVDDKGDALYTFFGQCPENRSNEWVPLFKASLRSLKMRPQATLESETQPQ